jgi:histidyl-tRNA synthetase
MRFLDKGDWEGMEQLLETNAIDLSVIADLKALSQLDGGKETLGPAKTILEQMNVDLDSFDQLSTLLDSIELLAPTPPSLKVNLCVARGLDYYTGMVFEIHADELGGEGQILGGGSYRLLHLFGLEDLDPSCGFGLGFDRVLLALEAQAQAEGRAEVVRGESPAPSTLMLPFRIESKHTLSIVKQLRDSGNNVEMDLRGKNIGKTLDWAGKNGFHNVIIVGPKDLENNSCSVKNILTGDQNTTKFSADAISSLL